MDSNAKFKKQNDESDAKGYNLNNYNKKFDPIKVRNPTAKTSKYYNMKHKERGLALIFNHEIFDIISLPRRIGTSVDRDNLSQVLENLGFIVSIFDNLKQKDIFQRIKEASESDHSNHDCILVCILSHGETGKVYAKDKSYKPESLWHSFTADKCRTLAGKPKLFFIQACQGDNSDDGVLLTKLTEADGMSREDVETDYKIPIHADFLISYSTVPGYVSYRNKKEGSWFIQILSEELRDYGTTRDLQTLLTFVKQRVATEYISYNPMNLDQHQKKQIPCTTTMLTRLLKFEEKKGTTVRARPVHAEADPHRTISTKPPELLKCVITKTEEIHSLRK